MFGSLRQSMSLNLADFDVSNVNYAQRVFGSGNLTALNLQNWNFINATKLDYMFQSMT